MGTLIKTLCKKGYCVRYEPKLLCCSDDCKTKFDNFAENPAVKNIAQLKHHSQHPPSACPRILTEWWWFPFYLHYQANTRTNISSQYTKSQDMPTPSCICAFPFDLLWNRMIHTSVRRHAVADISRSTLVLCIEASVEQNTRLQDHTHENLSVSQPFFFYAEHISRNCNGELGSARWRS